MHIFVPSQHCKLTTSAFICCRIVNCLPSRTISKWTFTYRKKSTRLLLLNFRTQIRWVPRIIDFPLAWSTSQFVILCSIPFCISILQNNWNCIGSGLIIFSRARATFTLFYQLLLSVSLWNDLSKEIGNQKKTN